MTRSAPNCFLPKPHDPTHFVTIDPRGNSSRVPRICPYGTRSTRSSSATRVFGNCRGSCPPAGVSPRLCAAFEKTRGMGKVLICDPKQGEVLGSAGRLASNAIALLCCALTGPRSSGKEESGVMAVVNLGRSRTGARNCRCIRAWRAKDRGVPLTRFAWILSVSALHGVYFI
jgi:hypothetical protein